MTYRSRPLGRRPEFWRLLACVALLLSLLNAIAGVFSFIDGFGFPPGSIIVAVSFAILALFCLYEARKWEE